MTVRLLQMNIGMLSEIKEEKKLYVKRQVKKICEECEVCCWSEFANYNAGLLCPSVVAGGHAEACKLFFGTITKLNLFAVPSRFPSIFQRS